MKINIIKILSFLVFLSASVNAQQDKNVDKGNKDFNELSYIDAREVYIKVIEDGFQTPEILKKLADSYYYNADYSEATKWYEALYNSGNRDPQYMYKYVVTLRSIESYTAADAIMEELLKINGNDNVVNVFVNERNYIEEIEKQSGRFELSKVNYNSSLSDFAPTFYQGSVVFASNRKMKRSASKMLHAWNEQPFLDLYTTGISDNKVNSFSKAINTKYHESTAVFTKDGMTIYFTRNNFTEKALGSDSEGTNLLKLYKGTRTEENSDWSVVELPFNSEEYSVAHPSLSTDEKTLYFASDMPGGFGESDLYKVSIDGDSYGEPQNLGSKINTESRETFPFIGFDNKLYFASTGHPGLGGLDVFVSQMNDSGYFGDVFNLGKPINSKEDDFTFITKANGLGYFASNRGGGKGFDDIYSFKSIKPLSTKLTEFNDKVDNNCNQALNGTVKDDVQNVIIEGVDVYLLDSSGHILDKQISDEKGQFSFKSMECGRFYAIRARKVGFSTAELSFPTPNETGEIEQEVYMRTGQDISNNNYAPVGSDLGQLLGLNIIYFDLDKSDIRPDAEVELRKIISILKLYPTMKIDIRSHTDSRAKDSYNMSLSSRRANSTLKYFVNVGGISPDRLTARGYGETQLTNGCVNDVPCTNKQHELNRRSEFIIVSK